MKLSIDFGFANLNDNKELRSKIWDLTKTLKEQFRNSISLNISYKDHRLYLEFTADHNSSTINATKSALNKSGFKYTCVSYGKNSERQNALVFKGATIN